jgi:hypothetical protein
MSVTTERLQALADSLTTHDLITCAQKWLRAFTPFFTAGERREASRSSNGSTPH